MNIELGVFRQIMKTEKFWKHLEDEVHSLAKREGIGKALTPEEESRLLTECAQTDSACYTAVVLALNSGMRKGEIRKLTWGQVDFFARLLTVGDSKTPASSGRVIPLNAASMRALSDWANRFPDRKPLDYIFPLGWRKAWRNACKRAGLKVRFHDLRHTAITKLAEGQASDQTIMSIAGHVSREMLEHYSHIRIAAKRTALDAISTPPPQIVCEETPNFRGVVHQIDNQTGKPKNGAIRKLLN